MPSKLDFIESASSYLGTRWIHQGRNRSGVDCVGLVVTALRDIGVEVADLVGYRRVSDGLVFMNHIRSLTDPSEEIYPGLIGLFRDGTQPCHVGIFSEQPYGLSLIHAYAPVGKVIEEPFIHRWPQVMIEARAIRELV